jgi:hypothetical protein
MQNRRERRKILKQFGLLKSKNPNGSLPNIEEGREIHRRNLQEMKNSQMKSQMESRPESIEVPETFVYRGDTPEYGNFQSMLLNRDWDEVEKD